MPAWSYSDELAIELEILGPSDAGPDSLTSLLRACEWEFYCELAFDLEVANPTDVSVTRRTDGTWVADLVFPFELTDLNDNEYLDDCFDRSLTLSSITIEPKLPDGWECVAYAIS